MNYLYLYLIAFGFFIVPSLAYFVIDRVLPDRLKNVAKTKRRFLKVLSVFSIIAFFAMTFHAIYAMTAVRGDAAGSINPNVGCVDLIGVPYGDSKGLNFLAWFGNALLYPATAIVILLPFFPFRLGKLLNRWIALPIAVIEFATLFNVCNAINGSCVFDFRNALIAVEVGITLSICLIMRIEYRDDTRDMRFKELVGVIGMFIVAFIACLPVNTLATLLSTRGYIFGRFQTSYRAYDLTEYHRFLLYLAIIIPFVIYFAFRNRDLNCRKVILLTISTGALVVFFKDYGSNDIFRLVDGTYQVNVTSLPIHLCHTALFIVPICIAFNFKRLFYFTYFINVFGAMCAMLMPNQGDGLNIYLPEVVLFWYNHINAFMMPLLAVALKIFPRAKFKQMLWSLGFFTLYYVLIVFLNAWLSNYVEGGTDYFFINGSFILDKIMTEKQVQAFINDPTNPWSQLTWKWGDLTFTIHPLYQLIFYAAYVVIAFAMWFVYALFFRIGDSHYDLYVMLKIAKKENLKMKEIKELKKAQNIVENNGVSLVFEHFSKRYGNSTVLSAKDINLKVTGGTIFGFLGPNGAGKSTCIKSAIGIQPVTDGHIFVCGHDVTTDSVATKKLIGYVPDHYALYEKLTGREYINYIADLYGVSKEDRDLRIAKYIDLFELKQSFDNRMQTYSHGMKQKMTIIAALVHNPKVWILDEPLTGLDPQSIYQVKQCMLAHAKEGNIVFFSSHIIDVVEKLCTRIAIIEKGSIIYENDLKKIEKEHKEGLESFYLSMIHEGDKSGK